MTIISAIIIILAVLAALLGGCCLLLKVGNPIFRNPKESLVCDLILIGTAAVDLFGGLAGWFASGVMDSQFWFDMILGICFVVLCVLDIMELRREREEIV